MVGTPDLAKFLDLLQSFYMKFGIVAQYSMPNEPQQNGVAERRNWTLMYMVHSMMSYYNLPLGL
jgi:transposase InsO family protein